MHISDIVTTYNRPDALRAVLAGLAAQTARDFVLVADDGSHDDTRELVERTKAAFPVRLLHVWQEDIGFRAGAARNRAAARAAGLLTLWYQMEQIFLSQETLGTQLVLLIPQG